MGYNSPRRMTPEAPEDGTVPRGWAVLGKEKRLPVSKERTEGWHKNHVNNHPYRVHSPTISLEQTRGTLNNYLFLFPNFLIIGSQDFKVCELLTLAHVDPVGKTTHS